MRHLAKYAALIICYEATAQSLLPGVGPGQPLRTLSSDSSVLDLQEPRHDFRCSVTPWKAQLGFDFLFHTGYRVTFPMKEFGAEQNILTILFRVTPSGRREEPVYFSQRIGIPAAEEGRNGEATVAGAFLVGAGRYHIDWLMRDLDERFCAGFWDIDARLATREAALARAVAQDLVQPAEPDPFADEPHAAEKPNGRLLSVRLIVDLSPHSAASAIPNSEDLYAVSAILRRISREPRIGAFSMVACSLHDRQVFYSQQRDHKIDLPALGKALTPANFATIGITQLGAKAGKDEFLGKLVVDELTNDRPDAVILVSSNSESDLKLSQDGLAQLANVPLFYLNYRTARYAWSDDSVGRMVKRLHGREYIISQPRDLFDAWSDLIYRIDVGSGR